MLTQEQIKNLKPGDKLVHEIYFIEESGDYIKCSFSPLFLRDKTTFLIDRAFLSLPSEIVNSQSSIVNKHDPCHLLKKCNSPLYRLMLQSVWEKRKSAHAYIKLRKKQNNEINTGDIVLVPARVVMVYSGGDAHLQIESLSISGKLKTTGLYMSVDKLTKRKEAANG